MIHLFRWAAMIAVVWFCVWYCFYRYDGYRSKDKKNKREVF